jgi:hypothetical protein
MTSHIMKVILENCSFEFDIYESVESGFVTSLTGYAEAPTMLDGSPEFEDPT